MDRWTDEAIVAPGNMGGDQFSLARCVDGLGTWAPEQMDPYRAPAAAILENGYIGVTESAMAAITG